jgi:DNA-binding Lrp family transcriptional regulator
MNMRPQDIVIIFSILMMNKENWMAKEIAEITKISTSEVSNSLERLRRAKLLSRNGREVNRMSLYEFVRYGLKYVFLVEPGTLVRGIATAHTAPPLKHLVVQGNDPGYVWPYSEGKDRGLAIEPLFKSVPEIVGNQPELYEMLALLDAIRIGRARERTFAETELEKRILHHDK